MRQFRMDRRNKKLHPGAKIAKCNMESELNQM